MSAVPRYDIDLDLPPMERWRAPVAAHKEQIHSSLKAIDAQIKEMGTAARLGVNLAGGYMRGAGATGAIMYYDEICAIAELADLPLGRLIALQLQYEAAAMCTSVVVSSKNLHPATSPVLVRTMDWDMEFLKPLTVQLTFHRSGRPLFVCTTWVGYVGVLTGMALRGNPNNFGISVNYRLGGPGWGGVLSNLRTRWPIAFLVRHVLENAATYEQCVMMLRTSKLISPVYFSVCGGKPHQGCLITREKKHDENFWSLDTHGPVVQANNDHYATHVAQDIMGSVYRSQYVRSQVPLAVQRFDEALAASKPGAGVDAVTNALDRSLWRLISEPRVCEDITIYGTAMVPALGYYDTRVPQQVQVPLGDGRAQICYALFRDTPEATAAQ